MEKKKVVLQVVIVNLLQIKKKKKRERTALHLIRECRDEYLSHWSIHW